MSRYPVGVIDQPQVRQNTGAQEWLLHLFSAQNGLIFWPNFSGFFQDE